MTIILLNKRRVVILKKYFSTFFALFCFAVLVFCIGVWGTDLKEGSPVYEDVLRFHILANSDKDSDQLLKIRVRDGIMPVMEALFENCSSPDEALRIATGNKELIEKAAERVLCENQSTQKAKVVVGKEFYPKRIYNGRVYPRGEYLSLRVVLGEGRGHNWWCVLFPSLGNVGVEYEDENSKAAEKGTIAELFGCRLKLGFLELFE